MKQANGRVREKHADGVMDVRPEKVISDAVCRSKQLVIFKSIKCHPGAVWWTNPSLDNCAQIKRKAKYIWIITITFLKVEAWKTVSKSSNGRNAEKVKSCDVKDWQIQSIVVAPRAHSVLHSPLNCFVWLLLHKTLSSYQKQQLRPLILLNIELVTGEATRESPRTEIHIDRPTKQRSEQKFREFSQKKKLVSH